MEDSYEKLEKLGEGTYGKVQRFILLPAMVAVFFTDCYALVQIPRGFVGINPFLHWC